MRIWKYQLDITDEQTVMIPAGSTLLDVQMQGDTCCLWALCDEKAEKEPRRIAIYGTGDPIPDRPGEYIATFQMNSRALAFHAFELHSWDSWGNLNIIVKDC